MNAHKRCVALDLAEPAGRAVFERLCAAADIVLADATWSEQAAIAGIGRAGARTRVVVIIDDGAVPGGCGSSETLAQAAMAITPYIGEPGGPTGTARRRCCLGFGRDNAPSRRLSPACLRTNGAPVCARLDRPRRRDAQDDSLGGALRPGPLGRLSCAGDHTRARPRLSRARRLRITLDFLPDQRAAWRAMCEELGLDEFADEVGDNWFSTIGMEDRIDWARPHYERALARFNRAEAVMR